MQIENTMKTKRTRKPITDIKEREYPQLGWVFGSTDIYGRGPLHISDKSCRQDHEFKSVTRCGRAIR